MIFNFKNYSVYLGSDKNFKGSFVMKNDTSYLEKFLKRYSSSKNYREVLLPLKIKCLLNIKEEIKGKYKTYFDLLAGIGISGRIFHEGESELNDFCPYCFEILKVNFPNQKVNNKDMFGYIMPKADFIFADFNNFTLKRFMNEYKPILDMVFFNAQKYVLINDCSVFYLKYGLSSYKTYEKIIGEELLGNLNDFYEKVGRFFKKKYPEWSLIKIEAFKDTSFLLFEKKEIAIMTVNVNRKEDIDFSSSLI